MYLLPVAAVPPIRRRVALVGQSVVILMVETVEGVAQVRGPQGNRPGHLELLAVVVALVALRRM